MWHLLAWASAVILPAITLRVLVSLGFGIATFTGINILFDRLTNQLATLEASISADVLAILNLMGFSQGLGIILGAVGTRVALVLVQGGLSRRPVWNAPGTNPTGSMPF